VIAADCVAALAMGRAALCFKPWTRPQRQAPRPRRPAFAILKEDAKPAPFILSARLFGRGTRLPAVLWAGRRRGSIRAGQLVCALVLASSLCGMCLASYNVWGRCQDQSKPPALLMLDGIVGRGNGRCRGHRADWHGDADLGDAAVRLS